MAMRTLFLMAMILSACTSVNEQETRASRLPAQYESTPSETLAPSVPRLNFKRLLEISMNSGSIEKALSYLYTTYPEYMRLHVLIYDTASIQESSFLEPRVLVHGPTAQFTFSFNGSSTAGGGGSFETMEYNEAEGRFLFREIAFKNQIPEKDKWVYTADFVENKKGNVLWSKTNPARCTQCHGQDPSPIWETYFLWPGAYGSNDDLLTSLFNRTQIELYGNDKSEHLDKITGVSQGRVLKLKPGFADVEVNGFKAYIANKHTHPRYQFLPDRPVDLAYFRWNAGEDHNKINIAADIARETEILGSDHTADYGTYVDRPNLFFNEALYQLTAKKFIAQTQRRPETRVLPYLLAWQESCSSLLPSRNSIRQATIAQYAANYDRDPIQDFKDVLTIDEIKQIRSHGSWRAFYREFLIGELIMETEKIYRMERTFGKGAFGPGEAPAPQGLEHFPSAEYFASIGYKVSDYERLICGQENDDPYTEAARAYVARGFNIDLTRYVTNLRRRPTFRENGFQKRIEFALLGTQQVINNHSLCRQLREAVDRIRAN